MLRNSGEEKDSHNVVYCTVHYPFIGNRWSVISGIWSSEIEWKYFNKDKEKEELCIKLRKQLK
jgi:hypothetical protein